MTLPSHNTTGVTSSYYLWTPEWLEVTTWVNVFK